MTNADKFKSLFGLYATELWAMPEKDFLKWLNSEAMNCSEFPNNSDTISRQAAIDIERNATVDTNPSHFEAHQKFTQFLDDAEISSFGRWQWSNGFNTALTAVGIDLRRLPTAQPERQEIRYGDCADATLKMWMDNVITDGEYKRIMDKLNKYWMREE